MHVFKNPIKSEDLDDEMTLLVGSDPADHLCEIGVVFSDWGPVVVPAMPARDRYLR